MNLVDSCGWLEYFADGPNADFFAKPLAQEKKLIVPTICIYEVFKSVLRQQGRDKALQAVALMQQGEVVDVNLPIAINAADISLEHKIPMADSMIIAVAEITKAVIWTQDVDFQGMKNVKYKDRE